MAWACLLKTTSLVFIQKKMNKLLPMSKNSVTNLPCLYSFVLPNLRADPIDSLY